MEKIVLIVFLFVAQVVYSQVVTPPDPEREFGGYTPGNPAVSIDMYMPILLAIATGIILFYIYKNRKLVK